MTSVPQFDSWSMPISLAIKVTIVLALVALAQAMLGRRASAATRHWLWAGSVVAILAIPVISQAIPGWEIPFERAVGSSGVSEQSQHPTLSPIENAVTALNLATVGGDLENHVGAPNGQAPARHLPWDGLLLPIYLLGVIVLLGRICIERIAIARLSTRASDVTDPMWQRPFRWLGLTMGIRRRVRLISSPDVAMPMTWGVRRPVIAVPAAATEWSDERRRAVLLHELAHVARGDALTQTLASLATALYWPHPGVWWAARRLRIERELACDDRVLRAGAEPEEYAGHLLAIARSMRPHGPQAMALAMARPSQLEGRLLALLDETRPRSIPRRRTRLLGGVAIGLLVAGVATAGTPQSGSSASLADDLASLETEGLPEPELFDKEGAVDAAWPRAAALSGSTDPTAGMADLPQQQQDTAQRILVSRDGRTRLVLGSAIRVERATDGGASRAVDLVIPLAAVEDIEYRDGTLTLTSSAAVETGMGPGGVLRLDGFDAHPADVEVFVRAVRTRIARETAQLRAAAEAASLRDGLESIRQEVEAQRRAREEELRLLRVRAEDGRTLDREVLAEAEAALRQARLDAEAASQASGRAGLTEARVAAELAATRSARDQQYNDVLRAIDGAREASERALLRSQERRELLGAQTTRELEAYDIHRSLVDNWMARETLRGSEPGPQLRAAHREVLDRWSALEARRATVTDPVALTATPEARAFTEAVRAFVELTREAP